MWRRIKRQFEPSQVVLFLPATLVPEALSEAHGELLTGHDGIYKTKERLFQCFYWPGMDADIATHLKSCHRCHVRCRDDRTLANSPLAIASTNRTRTAGACRSIWPIEDL